MRLVSYGSEDSCCIWCMSRLVASRVPGRICRPYPGPSLSPAVRSFSPRALDAAKKAVLKSPWRGLQMRRKEGKKAPKTEDYDYVLKRDAPRYAALDAAVVTMARTCGVSAALSTIEAAQLQRPQPLYEPGPDAAGALLGSLVQSAPRHLRADAAVEGMMRLKASYGVLPTAPVLAVVARAAAHDRNVEARSQRVMSVIRTMRRARIMPTAELIRACFDSCVAGLDVPGTLALFEFARAARFLCATGLEENSHPALPLVGWTAALNSSCAFDEKSPHTSEISYYNGVIQATLYSGKYEATLAAFRELSVRNLQPDAGTYSLLAAYHADRGNLLAAVDVIEAMYGRGEVPTAAAYASMIRVAGARGEARKARELFDNFVTGIEKEGVTLVELLSPASTVETAPETRISSTSVAAARGDVVLSMFLAIRATTSVEDGFSFISHLRNEFSLEPTSALVSFVVEACWRAQPQRVDLAQKLRAELSRKTHPFFKESAQKGL